MPFTSFPTATPTSRWCRQEAGVFARMSVPPPDWCGAPAATAARRLRHVPERHRDRLRRRRLLRAGRAHWIRQEHGHRRTLLRALRHRPALGERERHRLRAGPVREHLPGLPRLRAGRRALRRDALTVSRQARAGHHQGRPARTARPVRPGGRAARRDHRSQRRAAGRGSRSGQVRRPAPARPQLRAFHPVGAAAAGRLLRVPARNPGQPPAPARRAAGVRRLQGDRAAGQGTRPARRQPARRRPASSRPASRRHAGGRDRRSRRTSRHSATLAGTVDTSLSDARRATAAGGGRATAS